MKTRPWKCQQCKCLTAERLPKGKKRICIVCRYSNGMTVAVDRYREGIGRVAQNYRMSSRFHSRGKKGEQGNG